MFKNSSICFLRMFGQRTIEPSVSMYVGQAVYECLYIHSFTLSAFLPVSHRNKKPRQNIKTIDVLSLSLSLSPCERQSCAGRQQTASLPLSASSLCSTALLRLSHSPVYYHTRTERQQRLFFSFYPALDYHCVFHHAGGGR